jgi:hypothetical protein
MDEEWMRSGCGVECRGGLTVSICHPDLTSIIEILNILRYISSMLV